MKLDILLGYLIIINLLHRVYAADTATERNIFKFKDDVNVFFGKYLGWES